MEYERNRGGVHGEKGKLKREGQGETRDLKQWERERKRWKKEGGKLKCMSSWKNDVTLTHSKSQF